MVEWLVEGLYTVLEGIVGRHMVGQTFWFFASVFIFILAANCVGLIPGAGVIGWGYPTDRGFNYWQNKDGSDRRLIFANSIDCAGQILPRRAVGNGFHMDRILSRSLKSSDL